MLHVDNCSSSATVGYMKEIDVTLSTHSDRFMTGGRINALMVHVQTSCLKHTSLDKLSLLELCLASYITTRHIYASTVLGLVILSVRSSVTCML